jgi:hypothetical protein
MVTAARGACGGVLDAGATRLGLHASGGPGRREQPHRSHAAQAGRHAADIETLCREAAEFHFATVCVNPCLGVAGRRPGCGQSGVGVCSVVGFPLGATTPT